MSRAIGKFLGDLLPATRKARAELTKFHWTDPKVAETHVTEVAAGRLRGFQSEKDSAVVFRGVPFATAPRLKAPQPVEPWKGERSCLRFGPACPQGAFGMRLFGDEGMAAAVIEGIFPPLPPDQSYWYGGMHEEECLNANVYTPSLDGKKRAVLVWIHGGAFCMGSNIEGGMYDASNLAKQHDAVVVTLNYRIGPFGFLHFPDQGITNIGIRDQIAGLEWVRDNVAKFGGDPGNVTILGESAGGMSVGALIGSPKARGLFHRAVPMSGATANAHSAVLWRQIVGKIEEALKPHTGGALTPETAAKLTPEDFVGFVAKTMMKPIIKPLGTDAMLWQPYRDGDVLPVDGAHSNLAGSPPILTGVMEDEFVAFEKLMPAAKDKGRVVKNQVDNLRGYFHQTNIGEDASAAEKWEKHATRFYELVEAGRKGRGLPTTPQDVSRGCSNLIYFEEPNFCLARDSGAYSYNLHFRDDGHGRDIGLLFRFASGVVQQPPSVEDRDRSDQFSDAVMAFARTGKPAVSGAEWKPYPEIMHLKATPEALSFKEELVGFQDLKADIVKDLGIETKLPQNIGA